MTLTATRETGTVRPTSSPMLRFLGGAGVMLLAITVVWWIIGYILARLELGPPPWGEEALGAGIIGWIAAHVLGLAGLAWFSIRRSDWMLFLGGITGIALHFLILNLLGIAGLI